MSMYSVSKIKHPEYGEVITIEQSKDGKYHVPFSAVQQAIKDQNAALQEQFVRLFIDNQILTQQQAEKWARDEYQSLPKCKSCCSILLEDIYTGGLFNSHLFCSEACEHKNQIEELEKLKDEEEIEYL